MSTSTFQEIEAILLNSQENPARETQAALAAVVAFCKAEVSEDKEQFLKLVHHLWDECGM